MAYKCIIFDFDGTLADTEKMTLEIFNAMSEKYRFSPIDVADLHHIKNLHIDEVKEIIGLPFYQLPFVLRRGQKNMQYRIHDVDLCFEKSQEFFKELHANIENIGILTSNLDRTVEIFLETHHLKEYFSFIKCSALTGKARKIKRVARRLGLKKHEILYIGDETRDILACHKAGVDVAAVPWGYNSVSALKERKPTYLVEDVFDILTIIKESESC